MVAVLQSACMRHRGIPALVSLVLLGGGCAGTGNKAGGVGEGLPKGISTWTYGYSAGIPRQVKKFNATAMPHLRFRYFFPYAGSVSFVSAPDLKEVFHGGRELPEPSVSGEMPRFEAPGNWKDQYFTRMRGYLSPPETGEYTFWIASDDDSQLYLSEGGEEQGKRRIAVVEGWTGRDEWEKYESQKSKPIRLEAGKSYYVEALHSEGGGADHLLVAWKGPGLERQVIDGRYLSPATARGKRGGILRECWMAKEIPAEEKQRFVTGYGNKAVKTYAESLPRGTLLLPIVDGRNPGGAFDNWTDEKYREVAQKVARDVLNDPYSAGVHIDIEPFRPSHIPFYKHLREMLNAEGKLTSMFVGFVNNEVMTRVFEACDIVVISGYDLGCDNSFDCYRNGMKNALARIQRIAEETDGHYLVGIPAAASWGEYEYTAGVGCEKKETGVKQEEYVRAATDLVCAYMKKPQCLGVSLWVMTDPDTVEDPTKGDCSSGGWRSIDGCCKFPNVIRGTVWKHLAGYCPEGN